jgi:hypothetical protein
MGYHYVRVWLAAICLLGSCAPAPAQIIYPDFSPGCALSGTDVSQVVNLSAAGCITGALPLASLPSIPSATVLGNLSGATATASALTPLNIVTMSGVNMLARVVATANVTTLSGVQTFDGVAGVAGTTVLLTQQTTASQNGIWIMSSSAWTRPVNFPNGQIIPQFCDIFVTVEQGTVNQNGHFQMNTLPGTVTIGTTSQTWTPRNTQNATPTQSGIVTTTAAVGFSKVAVVTGAPGSGGVDHCVSFTDPNGSLADLGNAATDIGPCMVSDANGHAIQDNASAFPSVNHGTLGCGNADASGCITGLSAVTSLTLTFGGAWNYTPACFITPAVVTAISPSASSVTWTLSAFTGTAYYLCM